VFSRQLYLCLSSIKIDCHRPSAATLPCDSSSHHYSTRSSQSGYFIPSVKTTIRRRNIRYRVPVTWNKLPIEIKKLSSLFICPIAIAYSYGTDNKISLRLSVCLCVCLSVRVSSLSRSHFFVDFHQI